MGQTMLEHVNFTVTDLDRTANNLCNLFGWHVRWKGDSIHGGTSVHVGTDESYVALYAMGPPPSPNGDSYSTRGGLNHIGVVVDDLDLIEERVIAAGFEPHSHADYEPGRRFYFRDDDGIEFEVVCYTQASE